MKGKKVWIVISAIVIIAVIIIGIQLVQKPGKEEQVIKIGAILPLTGNISLFGGWLKEGIDFAIAEHGAGVKVLYEDNQGEVVKAVTAFHKLADVDKVNAVITAQTPIANALIGLSNSKKTFTIFTFADLPEGNRDYILNYHFPVQDEAKILAEFAFNELGKKAAILVTNDEFGRQGEEIFKKEFEGTIVYSERLPSPVKDVRSTIQLLKNSKPDFVFLIAYTHDLVAIVKEMKNIGIQVPVIGPNVLTVYLSLIKDYLPPRAYFTASLYDAGEFSTSAYKEFIEKYKNKTGKEPNMVIAEAYEATKILLEGLTQSKSSSDLIKFFEGLKTYNGIFGEVKIDTNRQAHFPLAVIEFQNGERNRVVFQSMP